MDEDLSGLEICPDRASVNRDMHHTTGIYVRAKGPDGRWASFDIAELTRDSLHKWLRSRGGENLWAENCVLSLLGHEQITSSLSASVPQTSTGE